jgi:hypothetical protein
MPWRWPEATRRVIIYALALLPVALVFGDDFYFSGWGSLLVLGLGWHISAKYMKPTHHRPSRRRQTSEAARIAELTKYDHQRDVTTWGGKLVPSNHSSTYKATGGRVSSPSESVVAAGPCGHSLTNHAPDGRCWSCNPKE